MGAIKLECDVAIIGASMGGVAAALAALEAGYSVILSEATDWLGGQMTSQGVSALDEHRYIESFGGSKSYYNLRQRIRTYYQDRYNLPAMMPDGTTPLNPGNGWVSRLCFEPKVAEQILREMLEPHVLWGKLKILYRHEAVKATLKAQVIKDITLKDSRKNLVTIKAAYFLDATDLGELLPLTRTSYVTGAEAQSETSEPHAPHEAKPNEVQSFTYCFAVEYCPGENHLIKKPAGYEYFRDTQPYTFTLDAATLPRCFKMFEVGEKGELPFWEYRRIVEASLINDPQQPNDIALINWAGNDYRSANLIDVSKTKQKQIMREAKDLSLGFLYWLQTECPRDDGGVGYPELKLRKDIMGTRDGLSKAPYIRESRRIVALELITEHDITASNDSGTRAKPCHTSVGIGWYQMDLHPCVGNDAVSLFEPTLPFQIPLGALIPKDTKNLLAACKNIGTTHLSNGAYRLHPVEWAIGEAAGKLAAFCLEQHTSPKQVWGNEALTMALQNNLLASGIPLAWAVNIPLDHPLFVKAQQYCLLESFSVSPKASTLELELDHLT
jgi:FAD dependent oxidoreductase